MKHIVITRIKFDDDNLFERYFQVMKEIYIPSIKSQTNKNFEIGFIINKKHIPNLNFFFDKNVYYFRTFSEAKKHCLDHGYEIQTRHDCDDWMSENYIEKIQQVYKQNKNNYDKFLIHSQVHKLNYQTNEIYLHNIPYWGDKSNSGFISSFLTLCQNNVDKFIFNGNHCKMNETTTSNIIYLNENLVRLTVHGNNMYSKIRDHDLKIDTLKKYDISLVIPTFDNTEYLKDFIQSVKESKKEFNVEILIGVDACEKTKQFVNSNKLYLDENLTFYFFEKNVGPYVIRNSLAKIANSENILFVDSDDLIHENLVTEIISTLKTYEIVRFKFYNFKNNDNLKSLIPSNINPFISIGQLGIRKNIFMSLNGFEPWSCSADSEFKMREEENKFKVKNINDILYFRRRHENSITSKKETSYKSTIRNKYNNIIKLKKETKNIGRLIELPTTKFYKLNQNNELNLINEYDNLKLFTSNVTLNPNKITNIYKNLTIIIPTFGNVKFLSECLDSITSSVKNLDCEILIGIDCCNETLQYVKNNSFDSRFKFYFFEKNVGPYIIKNSLSKISNSEFLLFFDSDDIMNENMINEVMEIKKQKEMIKPSYVDFIEKKENTDNKIKYGEGVFAIKKSLFLGMNGFEPWRCAADSDFMGRLYKNNVKLGLTGKITFYRRLHPNSLTQNPETGYYSKLRKEYFIKSKNKNKTTGLNPKTLVTENFTEVNYLFNNYENKELIKKEREIKVNNIKNLVNSVKKEIDYDKINSIKPENKTEIKDKKINVNKPKNREELIVVKKGSIREIKEKFFRNIFSKKPSKY